MPISSILQNATHFKPRTGSKSKDSPSIAKAPISLNHGSSPDVEWNDLVNMYLSHYGNSVEEQDSFRFGYLSPSAGLSANPDFNHCFRIFVFQLIDAPRSNTEIDPALAKIFLRGKDAENSIHKTFEAMAERNFGGIVKYIRGKDYGLVRHGTLPIVGEFDSVVETQAGQYLMDIKTIGVASADALLALFGIAPPKTREASVTPKKIEEVSIRLHKYQFQVNTYLGLTGIQTGYLLFEENNTKRWLKPASNFRVDYNEEMFVETEDFTRAMVAWTQAEQIPPFDSVACHAHVKGCPYTDSCMKELNGVKTFNELDQRSTELKKYHLEVVTC